MLLQKAFYHAKIREMRRMKPDASAPRPFRAGFRQMRVAERVCVKSKNPTMNHMSDKE